jgi:hypothetical protein
MRPIPPKLKQEILDDKFYSKCARNDEGNCQGRITWEHAIIHAGRQLNEKWAIIPICAFHHGVDLFQDTGDMNKEKHVHIALQRATERDLRAISKAIDYVALKARLELKYGKYNPQR